AALVRRGSQRNRIVECAHVTKGALWDSDTIENEIIAAYFPTAAALIKCTVDRIYTDNISKVGHTIASDNLLNLRQATEAGRVKKGDYMLLFTFGYGSNWACMV